MRHLFRLFLCVVSISPFSCQQEHEIPQPISDETFVEIYSEAVLIRAISDSLEANLKIDSLFRAHDVSRDAYRENVLFYNADKKRWEMIYERIKKRLDVKKKAFDAASKK